MQQCCHCRASHCSPNGCCDVSISSPVFMLIPIRRCLTTPVDCGCDDPTASWHRTHESPAAILNNPSWIGQTFKRKGIPKEPIQDGFSRGGQMPGPPDPIGIHKIQGNLNQLQTGNLPDIGTKRIPASQPIPDGYLGRGKRETSPYRERRGSNGL